MTAEKSPVLGWGYVGNLIHWEPVLSDWGTIDRGWVLYRKHVIFPPDIAMFHPKTRAWELFSCLVFRLTLGIVHSEAKLNVEHY